MRSPSSVIQCSPFFTTRKNRLAPRSSTFPVSRNTVGAMICGFSCSCLRRFGGIPHVVCCLSPRGSPGFFSNRLLFSPPTNIGGVANCLACLPFELHDGVLFFLFRADNREEAESTEGIRSRPDQGDTTKLLGRERTRAPRERRGRTALKEKSVGSQHSGRKD